MASVSASHLIIFIAAMLVATAVAGTLTAEVNRLSSAIDEQGLDVSKDVRTDIEVISDSGSANCCHDEGNVTLLVKNTGSQNLPKDANQVDILVNGSYEPDIEIVEIVDSGETEWNTGNVARINATVGTLSSGDHRVKIIVNGDEEVFTFRK